MTKTRALLIALGVLLAALLGYACYTHLEWHESSERSGYSEEALRNDYHAGLLLLTRLGYPAERSEDLQRLDHLAPESTLLLLGQERFAEAALRQKLLAWLEAGGHLVLPLSPDAPAGNPLLEPLGIHLRGRLSAAKPELTLRIEAHEHALIFHDAAVFDLDKPALWQANLEGVFQDLDDDQPLPGFVLRQPSDAPNPPRRAADTCPAPGATASAATDDNPGPSGADDTADTDTPATEISSLYARFAYGKGFVTLGSMAPFSNQHLQHADHARLFVRLMSLPENKRPVLMLFAPHLPSLLSWLITYAPEALFGLALLLLAGLWRLMPRFGPLQPEAPPIRPGLRDHLAASGQFLLKHRAYEALIAPLREAVLHQLEHLQHRHPEIEGPERLGEHLSGIKAAEIARALRPEPDSQHEFLRRCQTLAALRACGKAREERP